MESKKVSPEVAEKEVNKWLDHKKVDENKRASNSDNIAALKLAIEEGYLTYDSKENIFVQKLKFPIGDGESIKEFKYKSRLKMSEVQTRTKNVKASDAFGMVTAYICALTGQNSGLVSELDTEDHRVAQSIAVFFL